MTLYLISNISAHNVRLCSSQHAAHGLRFEFPWSAVHLTDMNGIYVTLITSRSFFTYMSSGLRRSDNDQSVTDSMQEFDASNIKVVQEFGLRCIRWQQAPPGCR